MSTSTVAPVRTETAQTRADSEVAPQECLTCRIIGTAALAGTGVYALNQSRAHAPGSVVGKRIMAGVGVCTSLSLSVHVPRDFTDKIPVSVCLGFLVASAFRWAK